MVFFEYEALRNGSERVRGKIEAGTEREARDLLRKQELIPVKINEEGAVKTVKTSKTSSGKKTDKKSRVPRLSLREKIDFTDIMYTFSKAGISLVESLYFVETNSESKRIIALATEIRRLILAGTSLSGALLKFPHIFDEVYIGLIKAGEESGELEETLKRLSYLLVKQDQLRSKVISTLAYPVFILILALFATVILLAIVFPSFKGIYEQMGVELPILTQLFMDIGTLLKQQWYLIPLIPASVVSFLYFIFTWDTSKAFLDRISLQIPIFEKFIRYTAIANFMVVMRVAFEAGITMVDSIMFANLTVRNFYLNEALRKVVINVQYGKSLSASLRESKVMPGIVMCMIATGEESGSLSNMLEQASEYIDQQIEKIVDLLSKLFEPFLFVIIGAIVLTLGLSLYLPLFQTYANIG